MELLPQFRPPPKAERERYLRHENSRKDPGYLAYLNTFIDVVAPRGSPGEEHDLTGRAVLDFGSGPNPVLPDLIAGRGALVETYDPFFSRGDTWKAQTYGLIVLHEVIEHLFEPIQTVRYLRDLLAPDGRIAVRTRFHPPSTNQFLEWWYRRDTTHVCFFAPSTMEQIGTDVLALGTIVRMPDITIFGPANDL